MTYCLRTDRDPEENFRQAVLAEIGEAVADLDDAALSADKKIHLSRRHCKALRALAYLYRPAMRKASDFNTLNRHFRGLARDLSPGRDAKAMLEAYDDVMNANKDQIDRRIFAPLRGALTRRKAAIEHQGGDPDIRLKAARMAFRKGETLAMNTTFSKGISGNNVKAVGSGLKATYKRARQAMRMAETDAKHLHEWRKWAKAHWYQCRSLQAFWPAEMKGRMKKANRLGELLGKHHDLTVITALVTADEQIFKASAPRQQFLVLAARRQDQLQRQAQKLGAKLFAEKGGAFSKRLKKSAPSNRDAAAKPKDRVMVQA